MPALRPRDLSYDEGKAKVRATSAVPVVKSSKGYAKNKLRNC